MLASHVTTLKRVPYNGRKCTVKKMDCGGTDQTNIVFQIRRRLRNSIATVGTYCTLKDRRTRLKLCFDVVSLHLLLPWLPNQNTTSSSESVTDSLSTDFNTRGKVSIAAWRKLGQHYDRRRILHALYKIPRWTHIGRVVLRPLCTALKTTRTSTGGGIAASNS